MRHVIFATALGVLASACGSSFPPPAERLASAEAAARSARELEAEREPRAALHLKLASEQIDQAKALMQSGDNKRADQVLLRAASDAELAVQLAKEAKTKQEAKDMQEQLANIKGK